MRSARTLAALAFAVLGLAFGVTSASAIDPFPKDGIMTLSNDNFSVHYDGDDTNLTWDDFITEEQDADIAGMLDRARAFFTHAQPNYNWSKDWPAPTAAAHAALE